ncbi:Hypothetical protein R9X50_00364600 [Acrodontium crateriforme]|uniref:F-box domain-containing protein n=1 Tax=Acrodontium crateriforme TaxID=150365 RepID=A0AAQ3R4D7_9PEZI|nr:Hypothetical protein R9X50_00364600 [Acrodontium crateriforme]
MTLLLDLPAELLSNVISNLPDNTVFETRLTCRELEKAALPTFGKRFFRKRGFLLTSLSLGMLKQVAQHDDLRKYVQHVWFNPDMYNGIVVKCSPVFAARVMFHNDNNSKQLQWTSEESKAPWEAYRACKADYQRTTDLGRLTEELATIFRLLPNIQTIGMRRGQDYNPYGWSVYERQIGEDPRMLGDHHPSQPLQRLSTPSILLIAICNALASSNVEVHRLYTDAIEIDNIKPEQLSQDTLNKACRGLLYLEINSIKGMLERQNSSDGNYLVLDQKQEWGSGLIRLFKATKQLKEIGLQIFSNKFQGHKLAPDPRNPRSWQETFPYMCLRNISQSFEVSTLTRVKLEKVATSPSILEALLQPSKATLSSLKLRDIRLISEQEQERPWEPMFIFLKNSCPQLSYIFINNPSYEHGGVSFVENPVVQQDPYLPHNTGNFTLSNSLRRQVLVTEAVDVTLEATGIGHVANRLDQAISSHWYQRPIVSFPMDDGLWYTDTSDEEW